MLKVQKKLMLEQETVEDLITKLRDMRFSNENTRKEFVSLISQLALAPDKTARKVIKKIGDYMTELGTEILNDTSNTEADGGEVEEREPYIIDMDESKLYKRRFVVEKKKPSDPADKHQLKTVKNPLKGEFLDGPSEKEAIDILKNKFNWTDKEIKALQK